MSLEKAIKFGKEHREQYRGSKCIDKTCRNHGGCPWCERNRKHKFRDKHPETLEEVIYDVCETLDQGCPECGNHLFKMYLKGNESVYICTYCGTEVKSNE